MGFLTLLIVLVLLALAVYVPYRISRRMGFDTGASALIGASGLFGLPLLIWWVADWPNEGSGPDQTTDIFR
ncbi:MAG: hypothetical protein AAGE18_19370 [Pseudomonadota bacterium]